MPLALANIGVAITRPVDQAKKLTQLITEAGGSIIQFPLIEIAALEDYTQFESVIANLEMYDWVIFISSNAVQNSMPKITQFGMPNHVQFAAIGPVTAKELQAFGVNNILTPKERFDSESLLALPEMHTMQNKKVMIVRGVGGREILADTLKARGAKVAFAECYQRINPQSNCNMLEHAWKNQQLQAIVVTSSEAMRHLIDLAGNAEWLKHTPLFVNHARIAELPMQLGLKVIVTNTLGDEAMLQALISNRQAQ
ncbi:MAG TPA: uroporphyrinogen-III synthase [Methylophilaceae bacterium]|nr:uroporphyrinogen-III synthase [Methylophilaceae bacterium]HAJ72861.1 uroporphyrinogen-III synthase [Methylophilaceae bacterium]